MKESRKSQTPSERQLLRELDTVARRVRVKAEKEQKNYLGVRWTNVRTKGTKRGRSRTDKHEPVSLGQSARKKRGRTSKTSAELAARRLEAAKLLEKHMRNYRENIRVRDVEEKTFRKKAAAAWPSPITCETNQQCYNEYGAEVSPDHLERGVCSVCGEDTPMWDMQCIFYRIDKSHAEDHPMCITWAKVESVLTPQPIKRPRKRVFNAETKRSEPVDDDGNDNYCAFTGAPPDHELRYDGAPELDGLVLEKLGIDNGAGKLWCCPPCNNTVRKGRVPGNAYVNNLWSELQPSVLSELTLIETQLISLVRTHHYIYKITKGNAKQTRHPFFRGNMQLLTVLTYRRHSEMNPIRTNADVPDTDHFASFTSLPRFSESALIFGSNASLTLTTRRRCIFAREQRGDISGSKSQAMRAFRAFAEIEDYSVVKSRFVRRVIITSPVTARFVAVSHVIG